MDMVEDFANQADESLEQVKIVAIEARKINNIPEHLDEYLISLVDEIERIDGLKNTIKRVCNYLPEKGSKPKRKRIRTGCESCL